MTSHAAALDASVPVGRSAALPLRRLGRPVVAALGALYAAAVVWATLRPVPWADEGAEESLGVLSPAAWLDLAAWVEGRPLEVAFNVALLVPIGAAVALLLRSRWAIVVPLALTLGIELAQIPLDRISHPRDLVLNAAGGVLGVMAVALGRRGWSGRTGTRYARLLHLAADASPGARAPRPRMRRTDRGGR